MSRRRAAGQAVPQVPGFTYSPQAPYVVESIEELLRRDLAAWRLTKKVIKRAAAAARRLSV